LSCFDDERLHVFTDHKFKLTFTLYLTDSKLIGINRLSDFYFKLINQFSETIIR